MGKAVLYKIHPDHPERHKLAKMAEALSGGALMLFPTDSVYAVGCDPRHHEALGRLRALSPQPRKLFTLICPSLAEVSRYGHLDDAGHKMMRALTPGPFTFLLKATKEVPRLVLDKKRKTAGVRVPKHVFCDAMLERLDGVIMSSSARLPGGGEPSGKGELFSALRPLVDVIVDDGSWRRGLTTVIDMTGPRFAVQREGLGTDRLAPFIE